MSARSRRLCRATLCSLLFSLAGPAAAVADTAATPAAPPVLGWSSLGAMPPPNWDGKQLSFHSDQGLLLITPLSDDVIRVRFTHAPAFNRDHSYAVINQDLGTPTVNVATSSNLTTLTTASLKLTVQLSPLRLSFANLNGETLDADDPQRGIAFSSDGAFTDAKQLRDDEHVYGFGEKNGSLDKRGWQLGGYNLVMWNSDTYMHNPSTDPLYVSVPFYLVTRHGRAHGLFLDNTWRTFFDVGREAPDQLTFGAANGELNYYFINGPDPKQVIERYADLTGHLPLPPRWALGYNQCRYSYYPEARVRQIANGFRREKIPADVIWLDIDYQDNYKPFTWDHERFPDPQKMISDLRAQDFRVICIVDAHPKAEKAMPPMIKASPIIIS